MNKCALDIDNIPSDRLTTVPIYSSVNGSLYCIGPVQLLVEQHQSVRSFSSDSADTLIAWFICHPSISDSVFSVLQHSAGDLWESGTSLIRRATVSFENEFCYLAIRGNRSLELLHTLYPRLSVEESSLKNQQILTVPYYFPISTAPYYAPEYSSPIADLRIPVPSRAYYAPEGSGSELVYEPPTTTATSALPTQITPGCSSTPLSDLKKNSKDAVNTVVICHCGSRLGRSMNGFDILLPRQVIGSMWRVMCESNVIVVCFFRFPLPVDGPAGMACSSYVFWAASLSI